MYLVVSLFVAVVAIAFYDWVEALKISLGLFVGGLVVFYFFVFYRDASLMPGAVPRPVTFANGFAELLSRALGVTIVKLKSRDQIVAECKKKTSQHDFGDEYFLRLWDRQIEACKKSNLSMLGRFTLNKVLADRCLARLKHVAFMKAHPELQKVKICPLVVTGPPRSGTTLLHRLIACDPQFRFPLTWEVFPGNWLPREAFSHTGEPWKGRIIMDLIKGKKKDEPVLSEIPDLDPRLVQTKKDIDGTKRLIPMMASHPFGWICLRKKCSLCLILMPM
jgi:hypothetical protein